MQTLLSIFRYFKYSELKTFWQFLQASLQNFMLRAVACGISPISNILAYIELIYSELQVFASQ